MPQRFTHFFISLALISGHCFGDDGSGLKTSVSVDLVGQAGITGTPPATGTLFVRGAEINLYSPADHLFDGQLSIAAHNEGGISRLDLHEAVVGSTKLIPRSRFRIGQFFLGVGRLNQFHQHDWPFITAPKVHQTFFADEGVLDTGIEYSYLVPTPFFLEFTAGITNGFVFGHDHSAGSRPKTPTHYLRGVTYFAMPGSGGAQLGINYLGRKASDGTRMSLIGIDFTAKWNEAGKLNWFLQSELWYQERDIPGADKQKRMGFYLYPQYYLGLDFFAGLRLDYFSFLNETDAIGIGIKNFNLNFVPTLTYKSSEFVLFRLAYNVGWDYRDNSYGVPQQSLELQSVIILGAHPAHDF